MLGTEVVTGKPCFPISEREKKIVQADFLGSSGQRPECRTETADYGGYGITCVHEWS